MLFSIKVMKNTVNLCFLNKLRYQSGICKLKFLEKTGFWGRGQSPYASVE